MGFEAFAAGVPVGLRWRGSRRGLLWRGSWRSCWILPWQPVWRGSCLIFVTQRHGRAIHARFLSDIFPSI